MAPLFFTCSFMTVASHGAPTVTEPLIDGGQFKEAAAMLDSTAKPSGNHGTTWTLLKADAAAGERDGLDATIRDVTARRDTALGELAEQAAVAEKKRAEMASQEPPELLAFYDRLRAQHGGVGAAALRQGRCEGCRLSFSTSDLNAIRAAAPDEVLRCEECRRILVRTAESGL